MAQRFLRRDFLPHAGTAASAAPAAGCADAPDHSSSDPRPARPSRWPNGPQRKRAGATSRPPCSTWRETDLAKLTAEKNVLVIVSTYGEGEPPDSAKALHDALTHAAKDDSANAIKLWPAFAIQFVRSATRITRSSANAAKSSTLTSKNSVPRECSPAWTATWTTRRPSPNGWTPRSLPSARRLLRLRGGRRSWTPAVGSGAAVESETAARIRRIRRRIHFPRSLLTSRNLNAAGSAKQVHHVEFDLGTSGLVYEAGDALGVFAHNCPELGAGRPCRARLRRRGSRANARRRDDFASPRAHRILRSRKTLSRSRGALRASRLCRRGPMERAVSPLRIM